VRVLRTLLVACAIAAAAGFLQTETALGAPVAVGATPVQPDDPTSNYECMGPGTTSPIGEVQPMCWRAAKPPCTWANDGLEYDDGFDVWRCECSIQYGCMWMVLRPSPNRPCAVITRDPDGQLVARDEGS
jgi:hypothetical protein